MGVALITPFKSDGSVDYNALVRLVEYQVQNGVDFLCVLGTTAETPTLTEEEKRQIKKVVIERVNGRVPILLGISSNCTQTVLNTLKNEDFTGVDAVLVAVPYYNKPSQEGIYQHYKAIAEATDLPVSALQCAGTYRCEHDGRNNLASGTRLQEHRGYQGSIGQHYTDGRHHQEQTGEFRRNLGRRRYYLPADYLGSRGRYLRYRKCLST